MLPFIVSPGLNPELTTNRLIKSEVMESLRTKYLNEIGFFNLPADTKNKDIEHDTAFVPDLK
jgi:hypothetical protein